MSKAYHAIKNFQFKEVINLVCYGAKYPETLTQTQRLTRLYRSVLRRQNQLMVEGLQGDIHKFNDEMQKISTEFYQLMLINRNLSSSSFEDKAYLQSIITKWEKWQSDMYEAQNFVEECRPYAPTSGRYYIFNDEQLSFDPFGYYKPRLLSDKVPEAQLPYFEDYPQNDSHWNTIESFPKQFDDTYVEKEELKKAN